MKKIFLIPVLLFELTSVKAQVTPATNVIAIDINQPQDPSYTYDSAYTNCYDIGMRQVGISFPWPNLETSPGVFNFTYLDIANYYYPAKNAAVDLTIAPINTNIKSVPSDLSAVNFDNTAMVDRFKILLDSIFLHIPNLQISSFVIGSEVDIYLGSNTTLWNQYTSFYNQVSAYAKSLRPGLKVSCEASLGALTTTAPTLLQTLNATSDYIGVSYYPLNNDFTAKPVSTVATDFAALASAYPSKPIYIYQYGYPSATICNSSENQQAQFITQTFNAWDTHASKIKMIDFTWLHDYSPAALSYWSTYYGISDPAFIGFLGSIGLRTYSGYGTNKLAYNELVCQANQRGYNSLTCITAINKLNEKQTQFSLFPNPATNELNITFSEEKFLQLNIFNHLGQEVLSRKIENTVSSEKLDISEFSSGVYFVFLKTKDGEISSGKIIVVRN